MTDQGARYTEFIDQQLELEYARRAGIDQRGLAVVTSSGAFTTLLFAVVAAVKGKDAVLPAAETGLVVAALVGLALAALVGLWSTSLVKYSVTDAATLSAMVTAPHWRDLEVDARNVCAVTQIRSISSLRDGNNKKATRVVVAIALQAAAFVLLSIAIISAL